MLGGLEEVGADLVLGEVVQRQVTVLVQQPRVAAVHHSLAREDGADPPRRGLEVDEPLALRKVAVERARGVLPERAGSECERHGGVLGSKTWRKWVSTHLRAGN